MNLWPFNGSQSQARKVVVGVGLRNHTIVTLLQPGKRFVPGVPILPAVWAWGLGPLRRQRGPRAGLHLVGGADAGVTGLSRDLQAGFGLNCCRRPCASN